jgi:uroporphyrinogen decarboxylase
MVYFYDDVAAAQSLLVSRDLWLRYIQPYHARLIDAVKSLGLQTMYHTDGAVDPLMEDFIAMGLDVLSPIQPEVPGFDPASLKERYGSRLAFHGGVSVTRLLPCGAPAEVGAGVKALVGTLGQGGGYVLASSHHIQADTPVANVLAMYDPGLR